MLSDVVLKKIQGILPTLIFHVACEIAFNSVLLCSLYSKILGCYGKYARKLTTMVTSHIWWREGIAWHRDLHT